LYILMGFIMIFSYMYLMYFDHIHSDRTLSPLFFDPFIPSKQMYES
jgi:hypothetical protein